METARFNLYGIVLLCLGVSLMSSGCATVSYAPTQDNVPKMSHQEATQKLTAIKNALVFTNNGYCKIADVKVSSDSVDIICRKRSFVGFETGETDKQTFPFGSIDPNVIKESGGGYFIKASGSRHYTFYFKNENDAVSSANALFALKRGGRGYSAPKDPAAEAIFQEEARKYREMAVKPGLPEEARKYAVQGDFAVEKKNLAAAVDRYEKALKVAPWWPEGHFKRGIVLADTERYEEAIEEMKKFLLLAPDAKEARAAQDNIYKWESAGPLAGVKTTSQASTNTDGTKVFLGKVERSIPTNPLWYGNIWCIIEAVADSGEKSSFLVSKTTTIYDAEGKGLSSIKRDKKAEIRYSIITGGNSRTNGKNGATSIRYLE